VVALVLLQLEIALQQLLTLAQVAVAVNLMETVQLQLDLVPTVVQVLQLSSIGAHYNGTLCKD
jgi:hypothetical protein